MVRVEALVLRIGRPLDFLSQFRLYNFKFKTSFVTCRIRSGVTILHECIHLIVGIFLAAQHNIFGKILGCVSFLLGFFCKLGHANRSYLRATSEASLLSLI